MAMENKEHATIEYGFQKAEYTPRDAVGETFYFHQSSLTPLMMRTNSFIARHISRLMEGMRPPCSSPDFDTYSCHKLLSTDF